VVFSKNDVGRVGVGASSHCAHSVGGDALREYLDWRPFEYFTCRLTPLPAEVPIAVPWVETNSFTAVGENRTEFRWTVRCIDRSAETLAEFEVFASWAREAATQPDFGETVRAVIAEDAALFGLDEAPV